MDCAWNPKDKMYYFHFITVVKLGDQANARILAPLKLLRTVLFLSSRMLALLRAGRAGGPSGPGALLWEGKEEQQLPLQPVGCSWNNQRFLFVLQGLLRGK